MIDFHAFRVLEAISELSGNLQKIMNENDIIVKQPLEK